MERTAADVRYTLTILWDDPAAPVFYTVSGEDDAQALFTSLPAPRPTLVCIGGVDWDRDLSPWPAEKVFRGGDDFSGGAEDFLHTLLTKIVPAAEGDLSPAWRGLFGYSRGGPLPRLAGPVRLLLGGALQLVGHDENRRLPALRQRVRLVVVRRVHGVSLRPSSFGAA